MRKIIFVLMLLGMGFAQSSLLFSMTAYDDNTIVVESITPIKGKAYSDEYSDYSMELLDENGNVLEENKHSIQFLILSDPPQEVSEIPVRWYINYEPLATEYVIKYNEEELLRGDLPVFCEADNICSGRENFASCPDDCPSGGADGLCDSNRDDVCDSDCTSRTDTDCIGVSPTAIPPTGTPTLQPTVPPEDEKRDWTGVIVGATVLVIIAMVLFKIYQNSGR